MSKKLSLKQQKFCKVAVATGNPTEAARRSYNLGSKGGKHKISVATSIASENLTKPDIQSEIQRLLKEEKIDKNSRLKRLAKIFNSSKDTRGVIEANKEITKMLGEYEQVQRVQEMDSDYKTFLKQVKEITE